MPFPRSEHHLTAWTLPVAAYRRTLSVEANQVPCVQRVYLNILKSGSVIMLNEYEFQHRDFVLLTHFGRDVFVCHQLVTDVALILLRDNQVLLR